MKPYFDAIIEAAKDRQVAFVVGVFSGVVFGATFFFDFGEGNQLTKTLLQIGSVAVSITAFLTFLTSPSLKDHLEEREERREKEKARKQQTREEAEREQEKREKYLKGLRPPEAQFLLKYFIVPDQRFADFVQGDPVELDAHNHLEDAGIIEYAGGDFQALYTERSLDQRQESRSIRIKIDSDALDYYREHRKELEKIANGD